MCWRIWNLARQKKQVQQFSLISLIDFVVNDYDYDYDYDDYDDVIVMDLVSLRVKRCRE
jgi:hypothetical protein